MATTTNMGMTLPALANRIQDDIPAIAANFQAIDTEFRQRGLNVKWFGAKGDGQTDDTQAIQNALNALITNGGGTLVFPTGTYKVNGSLSAMVTSLSPLELRIIGHPGTVIDGTASTSKTFFYVGGSRVGTSIPLSANVTQGSSSINLATPINANPGDILLITSTDLWNPTRTYYYKGEMVQVDSVSGTTVNLKSQLFDSYNASTTVVYQLAMPKVHIEGLSIRRNSNDNGLDVQYARDLYLSEVKITGARDAAINLWYIFGGLVQNNYVTDCYYNGSGTSYGIAVNSSQHLKTMSNRIFGGRHAITHGGQEPNREIVCESNFLDNVHSTGVACLDFHGNCEFCTVVNNNLLNGFQYSGRNLRARNNTIYADTVTGMAWIGEMGGEYLEFDGNTVIVNPANTNGVGLQLKPNATNITVSTVKISNNVIRAYYQGIVMFPFSASITGCSFGNVLLTDNDVRTQTNNALNVHAYGSTYIAIDSFTVKGGWYEADQYDAIFLDVGTSTNVHIADVKKMYGGRSGSYVLKVQTANNVDVINCFIDSASGYRNEFDNTGYLRFINNTVRNFTAYSGVYANGPSSTYLANNAYINCAGNPTISTGSVFQPLNKSGDSMSGTLSFTNPLSAANQLMDLEQGYGLYSDNVLLNGNPGTRLWFNVPSGGDFAVGPRNGSTYGNIFRVLRFSKVWLDGYVETTNNVLDDGSGNATFLGNGTFQKGVTGSAFATTSRPTGVAVGTMIFDTTLNKPVWYKGSGVWVDATGTTV
jgi:hypothetical protein